MTHSFRQLASAATLALAALPALAVAVQAHAATPAIVHIGDLNFARATDVAEFHGRVERVADGFCASRSPSQAAWAKACRIEVRREALAALPHTEQQAVLRQSQRLAAR